MALAPLLIAITLSILLIIALTSVFKYNTFFSMLVVSLLLAVVSLPAEEVVPAITQGFGNTMKSIGIIIILGITIGIILDKTGATLSMANAILRITGRSKAGLAIGITGYVCGIPIFCDSGFVVLSGINRSLARMTGKPMIFMASMLAAGLYSVHCLIPPHPGAMAAAGIIGVNIGNLILAGLLLAVAAAGSGFLWARFMTRREEGHRAGEMTGEALAIGKEGLPSTFFSFMPVIVPLLLLTIKSIVLMKQKAPANVFMKLLSFIGSPEISLLIGVMLALPLFKEKNKKVINDVFSEAIDKTGQILLLTAAGGIFGAVIKATGVGAQAGGYLAATGLGLFIPFGIAAFLKTAQGSSTVAIMTTASIVAPMLAALNLDTETGKLLATLAMGSGSMMVSHANDSYFWVVARFSDLDIGPMLRVYSYTTFVMGMVSFLSLLIASWFVV